MNESFRKYFVRSTLMSKAVALKNNKLENLNNSRSTSLLLFLSSNFFWQNERTFNLKTLRYSERILPFQ